MANSLARPTETRRLVLLHRREPLPELDLGIDYVVQGTSETVAAAAAGLTKGEWDYCVELGSRGHPAFSDFYNDLLLAKAHVGKETHVAIHRRGVEDGDLKALAMTARIQGIEDGSPLPAPVGQGGGSGFGELTIKFREFGEVVDVEDAEVVG